MKGAHHFNNYEKKWANNVRLFILLTLGGQKDERYLMVFSQFVEKN